MFSTPERSNGVSTARHDVVRYGMQDSPLGRMLVAARTCGGVCCVGFADRDDQLRDELRKRCVGVLIREDNQTVQVQMRAMLDCLSGSELTFKLPLQVKATAFQREVWTALQAIPSGETRTYALVARAIGKPSGARAVAHACAANPVAIAIPCHRVVGAGGSLTGYRWGLERKQKLLAMERERATAGGIATH